MFIELTLAGDSKTKILININHIVSFYTNNEEDITIHDIGGNYFKVKESYKVVKAMIKESLANTELSDTIYK